jgi:tetraacyldisaccharide 4'-kinase
MNFVERLYYIGYSIKKCHKLKNRKRLPCKVISVGNITVGGTGKTPAVMALAKEAHQRGLKPCILTRGYRGTAKGPCFVSRGEGPLLDEKKAGDEAVLMALHVKGIPIVKGPDRYEAGMFALESLSSPERPDLFLLDDGFQHWGLFRDKDILLVDGINPFGTRRLLPVGTLRAPVSEIKGADIIVITRTSHSVGGQDPECASLTEEIKRENRTAPLFFAEHMPSHFVSGTGEAYSLAWAKDKTFFGFCGIGNPESFRETLLSAGAHLLGLKSFRDHYRYSLNDLSEILLESKKSHAGWIVTTEKDIMRLKGIDLPENLLALAIEFHTGEGFYHEVFNGMRIAKPKNSDTKHS